MQLRVLSDTVFKQRPVQSSELSHTQKQSVRAGTAFEVSSHQIADGNHVKVTLTTALGGRTLWYVFAPHVQIGPPPVGIGSAMAQGLTRGKNGTKPAAQTTPPSSFNRGTKGSPAIPQGSPAKPNRTAVGSSLPPSAPSPAPVKSQKHRPAPVTPTAAQPPRSPADPSAGIGGGMMIGILGGLCLLIPIAQVGMPQAGQRGLNGWGWTGLGVGAPLIALGAWSALDGAHKSKTQQRDRLRDVFFRLLDHQNGEITVLQFAREAKLSGDEARAYLDERATEFNATFDVNTDGGISYHFDR
jgi:hypothetical protein